MNLTSKIKNWWGKLGSENWKLKTLKKWIWLVKSKIGGENWHQKIERKIIKNIWKSENGVAIADVPAAVTYFSKVKNKKWI